MSGIQQLLEIMAQLRNPDGGCPWDLQQDFESISPFTIEEAYEVDEAIASGDLEALRDELGDLLFQVVFQARIAEERGAFDFEGVTEAIRSKLVRRHPHVFADADTPPTMQAQTATWESIKAAERAESGRRRGREGTPDPFEGIPRKLPALARSAKLMGRLARLGGEAEMAADGPPGALLDGMRRTVDELATELEGAASNPGRDAALRLVGEGLRSWVGLARALGVDPEQALRQADDDRIDSVRNQQARSNVHQGGNTPHR
jgi:ATP diphosphatase